MKNGESVGSLRSIQEFRTTLTTEISRPITIAKINMPFLSDEGCVNALEKLAELHVLKDLVLRIRQQTFHWNLENAN